MKRETYSKDIKIVKEKVSNKKIILIIDQKEYKHIVNNNAAFKSYFSQQIASYPELFPELVLQGKWTLNGYAPKSKKQKIKIRRIKLSDGSVWQIHPSFVMPYMSCSCKEASKYLFLLNWCPYWALAEVFGKYEMFYYRLHCHFGHYNMVGTTVKDASKIPVNLSADEKHAKISGKKVYLGVTCGDNCFLGASISPTVSEKDLTIAYNNFKEEANSISEEYEPETVNTDGWFATMNAWKNIFNQVLVIQCFLHAILKIKNVATKATETLFREILDKSWNTYQAKNKRSFSQRIRRLSEYAKGLNSGKLKTALSKLCAKKNWFTPTYDYIKSHRTSNMVDRLINRTDRRLQISKWWHGKIISAEVGIRAFCLIQNFCPYCPIVRKKYEGQNSAFERLNGYKYSDNWVENLLIATSIQQKYKFQQKKLE